MKNGFRATDSPKTFQDAILVTRELDIPYLCIDSLGIIKDDRRDWEIGLYFSALVFSGSKRFGHIIKVILQNTN